MNQEQLTPPYPTELLEKANKIELLICDVDGVLTNGQILFSSEETEYKSFHVHDGLGLKLLEAADIERAIITARKSSAMMKRMSELNISLVFQGQDNKRTAYDDLKKRLEITDERIAYIGDDLPDLSIMKQAGLSVAVANANAFVKQHAHWTTAKRGGEGAVREVCELILQAQNKLDTLLETYVSI